MMGVKCQKKKTVIPPTGILLFNGNDGDTSTPNLGLIGTVSFYNGAIISNAKAYEGETSCRLSGGAFARYSPTSEDDNNNLSVSDFYLSTAFNFDITDSNQRGLLFAESNDGYLLFRAYHQNGVVKCVIKQIDGTQFLLAIPTLVCVPNTWYKLELIRNHATGQFTLKVGSDSVSQAFTEFANTIAYVDICSYWGGGIYAGYVDRFVYRKGSSAPY